MENRFKTALDIQDACNLTAVVGTFHKMCLEVLHESQSTVQVTKDPAIIIMVDKINDLLGRPDFDAVGKAWEECYKKSQEAIVMEAHIE
jgi:hypothetical protein